jgi:hypothetical protein
VPEGLEPQVWAVAGCLFEVSLPADTGSPWRWMNPHPVVTLVAEGLRGRSSHLRFRAEAAGDVELRFGHAGTERAVLVRIVPEAAP